MDSAKKSHAVVIGGSIAGLSAARRFHRAQWKTLRPAWGIATKLDMEWPGTLGKRPFSYKLEFVLGVAVARAAAEDPQIKRLLGPVYQLVASPLSLLHPTLVLRVAFASLRRRFSRKLLLTTPADTSILPALSLEAGE